MLHLQVSADIEAAIEAVVLFLGAFDLIADFHPQIAACQTDGDEVGATRRLWLSDGQEISEVLTELAHNGYSYRSTAPSHGMARWEGRIEVEADGEHSRVKWSLDFEPTDDADPDRIAESTRGLFEEGLASAKRQLEGLTDHGV